MMPTRLPSIDHQKMLQNMLQQQSYSQRQMLMQPSYVPPFMRDSALETEIQDGYWQASEEIYNDPTRGGCPILWRADASATRAGEIAQREAKRYTNAKRACSSLIRGLYEAFKPPSPDDGVRVGEVIGYRAWRRFGEKLFGI